MEESNIRQRRQPATTPNGNAGSAEGHPSGKGKHAVWKQVVRFVLFAVYSFSSCVSIVLTQWIGIPLYWYNRDIYYAYMALTKQSFGLIVTSATQWWTPTKMRVSGDASVAGQMSLTKDGRVEFDFPERMVMIANHQLYTEWAYLWWIAYTNKPRMHGHIYIMLKESLRNLPILGWGMRFYGFIFMSRKMETDEARMKHRLDQLKEVHSGPMSGPSGLDPMWLLIFPEGTNASANTRKKSAAFAAKMGIEDMKHTLLPRSTGTFFCLNELKGTVDYVYDCTMAYEGVPRGKYGEDYYTLQATALQGQVPPSVNMYWRRFALSEMPLHNKEEFDLWLRARWTEKDELMEHYLVHDRFPGTKKAANEEEGEFIEAYVQLTHWYEVFNIFVVLGAVSLVANLMASAWNVVVNGKRN